MWSSNILEHIVTYNLFIVLLFGFFTWKAKCFFPNLLSIQAISIFQSNVCCKNHVRLVTFYHTICLLSKRFFSDESEKVWKLAETNTKIHLKDMVLVDDLLSLLFPPEFVWGPNLKWTLFLESEKLQALYHSDCFIQIKQH